MYTYWVAPKVPMAFSTKDTFSFFTNNFIDLDILSMWLSPAWCSLDCSQFMSQFDHYQRQPVSPTLNLKSIIQWEISSPKFHQPLLTHRIGHSTFSTHCMNLFLCFSYFYLSSNNKAWNDKNAAYFLPSSVLKWLHKNSPILISVFKCALMWQLSQCNITKLFHMKLNTTKHY